MIENLPLELFIMVIRFIRLKDLYSLRLTSQRLERKSIRVFSAAAFSEVRVDFTPANLRWLSNVASHGDFRLAVHSLRVGAWEGRITRRKPLYYAYGVGGLWPRSRNDRINYRACDLAQQFVRSLLKFPNCGSITVTDRLATSTYALLHGHLSSADAVALALQALSVSTRGAPLLRNLHIAIRSGIDWQLPGWVTGAAVASARRRMTQLEELNLELGMDDTESITSLLQLIEASPRLRTLRLSLNPELRLQLPQCLVSILHFPLPSLSTILLSGMTMDESTVTWILSNSTETLKRLDFDRVALNSGSWSSVIERLVDTPFRDLRRFSMFACRDGPAGETVAFCPLWRAQKESAWPMDASPGALFYFWHSVTADMLPKTYHITGAAFESETGGSGAKRALGAMVGYSHRCPRGGGDMGLRCVDLRETGEMFKDRDSMGELAFRERWTGWPP